MLSKPAEQDDEDVTHFWLITYSDMITLLFAFFLLIYSFTVMSTQQQDALIHTLNVLAESSTEREVTPDRLEKTAAEIAGVMAAGAGPGEEMTVPVESSEREVTIILPTGLTFPSGEARLTDDAYDRLLEVGELLLELDNPIRIEGHTDNVPIRTARFPSNWHLSVARAQAVLQALLDAHISPRRAHVVGFSHVKPRASNDTPEGRSENRRVEIKLIRREKEPEGGQSPPPPRAEPLSSPHAEVD